MSARRSHLVIFALLFAAIVGCALLMVPRSPLHQEATLGLDLGAMVMPLDAPYEAYDELTNQAFQWWGANPYVRLVPQEAPAHILHLRAIA